VNYLKYINYIVFVWALEAANLDQENTKKTPEFDFAVGGQAVVEGIMMRSPNNLTIAVRKPKGNIIVKKKPFKTFVQRFKFLNIPILRGVINLFEMMIVGTQAINYSAAESVEDEPAEDIKRSIGMKIFEAILFTISFLVAIALSITLFKYTPLWITTFLESRVPFIKEHWMLFNLIDGIIKTSIFVGYIYILTLAKSFRRIFEYHGAEHKSIFTYEKKLPLTPENATKQTRFHPRCGTSFVLIVFIISILVYTVVPKQDSLTMNLLVRLAFLPLIAGISYEILKFSAKHNKNIFMRAFIAPGLWFQRLTTKEPDSKQLEVGLKSLSDILELEKTT
jgi:uncharacterized protein YqhQ